MKRITIKHIFANPEQYFDKQVTVSGWVKTLRDSKVFGFIELNDGSCFKNLQIVFEQGAIDNFEEIAKLNVGSSVWVEGVVVATPQNKQPLEIKATKITIEGKSTPDYPLQKKRHTVEYLREIAHLRPRTNLISAVMRVRSVAAYAIHSFFNENDFVYVHTPLITASDCEGAGEMFRVTTLDVENPPKTQDGKVDFKQDFFGKSSFLTVSGQLNVETYCMAFGKVYTFGPTFRAEVSNTQRHAAEFWMIEPEIAFADLSDTMDLAESMTKYVIKYVLKHCPDEIAFFNNFVDKTLLQRLTTLADAKFARMTYTQAVELLSKNNDAFEYPISWGQSLQTEHEKYLTEKIVGGPLFVTDYPQDVKAFYMRLNDDGKTVACTDMLVPGIGELIGGSQREERLDVLLANIKKFGLKEEDYWWYNDLRKYGGTKHGGYGIGFERLIMFLTGVSNIRDVLPFPRTSKNAQF